MLAPKLTGMHGARMTIPRNYIYQIVIEGELDPSWAVWMNGMTVETCKDRGHGSCTTLTGAVVDQSALRGILNKLWDLNLELRSVSQIQDRQRMVRDE